MGVPGAGKTTWMEKQTLDGVYVASTEIVRKDRNLDVDSFFAWLRQSSIAAVADGLSVISDGTNIDFRHRKFWLNLAAENNVATKLVVFKTDLALCLQAQTKRTAPVPNKLVRKYDWDMGRELQKIKSENWDSIEYIIRSQTGGY